MRQLVGTPPFSFFKKSCGGRVFQPFCKPIYYIQEWSKTRPPQLILEKGKGGCAYKLPYYYNEYYISATLSEILIHTNNYCH